MLPSSCQEIVNPPTSASGIFTEHHDLKSLVIMFSANVFMAKKAK